MSETIRRERNEKWRQRGWGLATIVLMAAMVCGALADLVRPALAQVPACPEPNDVPSAACDLPNGTAVQGTIETADDIDGYRFVLSAGDRVQIDLTDLPADYDLYLADESGAVMGQSVKEGLAPERIQLTVQPGTYFVFVRADAGREVAPDQPYSLTLTLANPAVSQAAPAAPAAPPPPPTAVPVPPTPVPAPPTPAPVRQPFSVDNFRFSYGDINSDFVGPDGSLPYRKGTPLRFGFQYRGAAPGAKFRYELIASDKFGVFGKPKGEFNANPTGQGFPVITGTFTTEDEKMTIEMVVYYEDREVGRASVRVG